MPEPGQGTASARVTTCARAIGLRAVATHKGAAHIHEPRRQVQQRPKGRQRHAVGEPRRAGQRGVREVLGLGLGLGLVALFAAAARHVSDASDEPRARRRGVVVARLRHGRVGKGDVVPEALPRGLHPVGARMLCARAPGIYA